MCGESDGVGRVRSRSKAEESLRFAVTRQKHTQRNGPATNGGHFSPEKNNERRKKENIRNGEETVLATQEMKKEK
jgi:hypothetical protein